MGWLSKPDAETFRRGSPLTFSHSFIIPVITMIVSFACYVRCFPYHTNGNVYPSRTDRCHEETAYRCQGLLCDVRYDLSCCERIPRAYLSIPVFDMLRDQMWMVFGGIPMMVQAKVSLDRLNDFLRKTELLDEFDPKSKNTTIADNVKTNADLIGIQNASFTWTNEPTGTVTPGSSRRNFTLRVSDEVVFRKGKINLIVGPTGCGKTSLLMALLGELHYIPAGPDSWCSLPRAGGVAYAAQESWVQNETIRSNILFGSPYDEQRYKKVIYQCGLSRDLSLFDAGDKTEVGEKGLTLSGGQKARVTLARAIYSQAQILILDDVLAALDVHTARWVVDKCLQGDLVHGRTVLLVVSACAD